MKVSIKYDESTAFLSRLDRHWADLISEVGPCMHDPKAAREPYEALIRAIAYQQLTAKAGDAIVGRLKALFQGAFPNPHDLVVAEFDALRACGFSARKVFTIRAIAEGTISGLVPPRERAVNMDDETLIARMTGIKGIGRWTVEMLLMYSLERMDVLPVDDFGVREGYRALKSLARPPAPNELRELGRAWAPHRTVAAWYLWRAPRQRANAPEPAIV